MSELLKMLKRYTISSSILLPISSLLLLLFILYSLITGVNECNMFIIFITEVFCNYIFYCYCTVSELYIKDFALSKPNKYYYHRHEIYDYYKNNKYLKSILFSELIALFLFIIYISIHAIITKSWDCIVYYVIFSLITYLVFHQFIAFTEIVDISETKVKEDDIE